MDAERFNRSIRFFGAEGQKRIQESSVAIVGIGGIGSRCVQEAAINGYGRLNLIDDDRFDHTSRNRAVGLWHDDPTPGILKVDALARLVNMIDPRIEIQTVSDTFISEAGFATIESADYVLGCLDKEWPRLVLLEVCASLKKPLIDIATEIYPERMRYGGRVCCCFTGSGCLSCRGQVDQREIRRERETPDDKADAEAIYGVQRDVLGDSGPSVGPINGIVACHGMAELMYLVTGVRSPDPLLTYNGRLGTMTRSQDQPTPNCYYCSGIWTDTITTDIKRHLKENATAYAKSESTPLSMSQARLKSKSHKEMC